MKSAPIACASTGLVAANAAQSRTTSQPRSCASATHSSGCWAPLKLDCAGYANSFATPSPAPRRAMRTCSSSRRRSASRTGMYVVAAPLACANSRIPLTELWLS